LYNELDRAEKEVVVSEYEGEISIFAEGAHENVRITDFLAET
jgi:hypothetical protein